VVVDELFSGGHCWEVVSTTCTTAAPDSVLITAHIQLCGGNPTCPCTHSLEPFQVTCTFPPLTAGNYRAVYQERHLNPYDSRQFPTHELPVHGELPDALAAPVVGQAQGDLSMT
jgi:hypothetical protein